MTSTWTAPEVTRGEYARNTPEREMLELWLRYHRETLLAKCGGLTVDQLRRRSVPPSTLSLLGLVRHMAEVERYWFRRLIAAQDAPYLYCDATTNPDGDFDDVDTADAEADFAVFAAEVAAADAIARGRDLDEEYEGRRGGPTSLRWVYIHMIEEYARHNGHADLIRQVIDGRVEE
jgi:hypothetical protein